MNRITVKIKRDAGTTGIPLPSYATPGAAGMDIRSSERTEIEPGDCKAVGTGLYMEIPEGYEAQLRPRSGLALKNGITLLNSPGTIDSDYRGEIRAILVNHGKEIFHIEPGDRIAQAVFAPVTTAKIVEIAETEELGNTERSESGFGSTGIG